MTSCPISPPAVRTVRLLVREPHRHPRQFNLLEFEIDILAAAAMPSLQLRDEIVDVLVKRDGRPRKADDYTLTLDLDASTPEEPVLVLQRIAPKEQ